MLLTGFQDLREVAQPDVPLAGAADLLVLVMAFTYRLFILTLTLTLILTLSELTLTLAPLHKKQRLIRRHQLANSKDPRVRHIHNDLSEYQAQ